MTCGSVVKLKHAASGYDLHSHEIAYGSGSGQQSVTGYKDTSDANSLWTVRGAKVPPACCIPWHAGLDQQLQHAGMHCTRMQP